MLVNFTSLVLAFVLADSHFPGADRSTRFGTGLR